MGGMNKRSSKFNDADISTDDDTRLIMMIILVIMLMPIQAVSCNRKL